MVKVLTVIGTRPEAIKLAPLIWQMSARAELFTSRICLTGQHRELLDQMMDIVGVVPDHDLRLMQPGQSLERLTRAVLEEVSTVIDLEAPDWVVVQGDTTTALGAGLAAFYRRVRLIHVEAGLRTNDPHEPFPEEANRRMVSALASMHCAPTPLAAANLLREGVADDRIMLTGNTVVDALQRFADQPFLRPCPRLAALPPDKKLLFVTVHRRENTEHILEQVCCGLRRIADENPDVHLVYPVHPNPAIREPVIRWLHDTPNISLLEPLDYPSTVWMLKNCHLVLTDSGGLQEEAPVFGKPVLVLRRQTERPEGVHAGVAQLVGTDPDRIADIAGKVLRNPRVYEAMARAVSPYGDGRAAERICNRILDESVALVPAEVAS
jgi:UDP-N-acetylglucosamine 2-epimerase (non-hydrolysing)